MRVRSTPPMPVRVGSFVRLKIDPRHIGRPRYVYGSPASAFVRVTWPKAEGPAWTSEHDADELIVISRQEAEQ